MKNSPASPSATVLQNPQGVFNEKKLPEADGSGINEYSVEYQKKFSAQFDAVKNLAQRLHQKQFRRAIDLYTGKPIPYNDHLRSVATEAVKMHAMIDPNRLKCPVEVMQMVAWLHDSLEDQLDETALRAELEKIFPQETKMVEMIVEGVKFLTKPSWKNFVDPEDTGKEEEALAPGKLEIYKKRREEKYYNTLENEAPLWVKLIKLSDNKHNMSTLDGNPNTKKALKGAIKYRESWEKMFSEEEREMLEAKSILPKTPEARTKALKNIYGILDEGKISPADKDQLVAYYRQKYEKLAEKGFFGILRDLENFTQYETEQSLYVECLKNPQKGKEDYYKILGVFEKYFPHENERIKKLKKISPLSTDFNHPNASYRQDYEYLWQKAKNITNSKQAEIRNFNQYRSPKAFEESLSDNTGENLKNTALDALDFLLETYGDDKPVTMVQEGVNSIRRIRFEEKLQKKTTEELQQEMQVRSLSAWQSVYQSILAVDGIGTAFSPTHQDFHPEILVLEEFLHRQTLTPTLSQRERENLPQFFTGRDFLDLDASTQGDNSLWEMMTGKIAVKAEVLQDSCFLRHSVTKISDDSDEIRKKGGKMEKGIWESREKFGGIFHAQQNQIAENQQHFAGTEEEIDYKTQIKQMALPKSEGRKKREKFLQENIVDVSTLGVGVHEISAGKMVRFAKGSIEKILSDFDGTMSKISADARERAKTEVQNQKFTVENLPKKLRGQILAFQEQGGEISIETMDIFFPHWKKTLGTFDIPAAGLHQNNFLVEYRFLQILEEEIKKNATILEKDAVRAIIHARALGMEVDSVSNGVRAKIRKVLPEHLVEEIFSRDDFLSNQIKPFSDSYKTGIGKTDPEKVMIWEDSMDGFAAALRSSAKNIVVVRRTDAGIGQKIQEQFENEISARNIKVFVVDTLDQIQLDQ